MKQNWTPYCRTVGSFLFIGAVTLFLTGCDGKTQNVKERWSADNVANADPALAESDVNVRVLVSRNTELRLNCQAAPYGIWDDAESKEWISLEKGKTCLIRRQNGTWQVKDEFGREMLPGELRPAKSLVVRAKTRAILDIVSDRKNRYRGYLRIWAEDKDSMVVVNVVDIELYLNGVVGAEMPSYWYKTALRAQCIASRTYALYQTHIRGGGGRWDLASDQSSQVYGGVNRESQRVADAVRDTRGVVLASNWKGKEKLFPAYYSSTCGGHTQDAAAVFGENLPALKGTICPYCQKVAKTKYYRWGRFTIDKEDVSKRLINRYAALAPLERIVDVKVAARSDYGRVEKLELIGQNGRKRNLRAEDFRLAISTREKPLLSSWYKLSDGGKIWRFDDGHGWGHGVGMCQCGTQGMARTGKNSIAILKHYYPQAMLVRAY
jgi:stage II sporulation protein D (peptidoglycan lytic transglycosylase)